MVHCLMQTSTLSPGSNLCQCYFDGDGNNNSDSELHLVTNKNDDDRELIVFIGRLQERELLYNSFPMPSDSQLTPSSTETQYTTPPFYGIRGPVNRRVNKKIPDI